MSRKRRLLLIAILCCGLARLSADELAESGAERFLSGDLQGAAGLWSRALEANPSDADLRMLLGNCLVALGKENVAGKAYRAGCDSFRQAAALCPERGDIRPLSLLSELENGYPTGDEEMAGDLFDVRNDLYAVFDTVFAGPAALPVADTPPPPEAPAGEQLPEGAPAPQGGYLIHIAANGETLGTIAQKYYNNFDSWEKIWKSNPQLKNPHRLFPGTRLVIPLPQ